MSGAKINPRTGEVVRPMATEPMPSRAELAQRLNLGHSIDAFA
jgi:hypothetical protein